MFSYFCMFVRGGRYLIRDDERISFRKARARNGVSAYLGRDCAAAFEYYWPLKSASLPHRSYSILQHSGIGLSEELESSLLSSRNSAEKVYHGIYKYV